VAACAVPLWRNSSFETNAFTCTRFGRGKHSIQKEVSFEYSPLVGDWSRLPSCCKASNLSLSLPSRQWREAFSAAEEFHPGDWTGGAAPCLITIIKLWTHVSKHGAHNKKVGLVTLSASLISPDMSISSSCFAVRSCPCAPCRVSRLGISSQRLLHLFNLNLIDLIYYNDLIYYPPIGNWSRLPDF